MFRACQNREDQIKVDEIDSKHAHRDGSQDFFCMRLITERKLREESRKNKKI